MTENSDAGDTRTRILDAAETLFARLGFDGTSTARIAHAAAVPKGLLFYYFPAKPDILAALIDERLRTAALDAGPLAVRGDPVQTLMNVGERVLRDREASDVLREILWHESHVRPEVAKALSRYRRALHDTVERALTACLPAGTDRGAVRAAADAWSATITARPLDAASDGSPEEQRRRLHEPASLRAIARVLGAGLQAATLKGAAL